VTAIGGLTEGRAERLREQAGRRSSLDCAGGFLSGVEVGDVCEGRVKGEEVCPADFFG
jgi:hypothetical protein